MRIGLGHLQMLTRFYAAILAGVPSVALMPLPVTLVLFRRYKREELLKRLHWMVAWAGFVRKHVLGIRLQVHGQEHLPRPSKRGYMIISNHQSYVDIPVLMEALDTVAFLSKNLVGVIPVIGQCAYAGGTVFLNRRDKQSRKQALENTLRMCRESTAVVVFPEGTRSADGAIRQDVRLGSMEAAHREGLPIIPVGLDGTFMVVPKTMDRVNLDRQVAVEIGPALLPAAYPDPTTFARAVWDEVNTLHQRCRERIT